jgi:hypothetical protein
MHNKESGNYRLEILEERLYADIFEENDILSDRVVVELGKTHIEQPNSTSLVGLNTLLCSIV